VNHSDPCREAERLVQLFRAEEQKLRHARRRLAELNERVEAELPLRDRTQLAAAKAEAQRRYHQATATTSDPAALQQAAPAWLDELNRLNRGAFAASRDGSGMAAQLSQLENYAHRLEIQVDASRIRAEAARAACNDARRAAAAAAELEEARSTPARRLDPEPAGLAGSEPPIAGLLRGDRLALQEVSRRLAEVTELEQGRLALLLIELCEQVAASALDAAVISVPAEHPFWSQFEPDDVQELAATLGKLGYRFDGRDGWLDERVPQPRHVAIALAHAGLDGRVRRQPTQDEINGLWLGARLESAQHLAHRAPDLSLDQVQDLLGARGATLDELWDNWADVRRALMH
jgi:hypothetical protein